MKKITRREFLGTSAMGLLALKAQAIRPFATRFDAPLFFQYWVVREPMGEDLAGSLKRMRDLGYDGIELCSPVSYGQFVKFAVTDPAEMRKYVDDSGLRCHSSHFTGSEVLDDVNGAIETANKLGLDTVYISSAPFNEAEATLDQWKEFAERSNAAGEVFNQAGLRLGYHNHRIAPVLDGTPQFDHLLGMLEPDLVTVQFQIAVVREGYDVVEYMTKYGSQISAMHLSDYDGETESGVPVGSGDVDWTALFKAARKGGAMADYGYIVEVGSDVPFEGVTKSYEYLNTFSM